MGRKVVSRSFTVETIEDGTSVYIADLTNEMDSVACDNKKCVKEDTELSTVVSYWYGATAAWFSMTVTMDMGNGTMKTMSNGVENEGVTCTWTYNSSTKTNALTVEVNAGTPFDYGKRVIVISAGTSEGGYKTLHFTINAIVGAAVYNLKPSQSQVKVVKNVDGSYSPSTFTLTCDIVRNDGGDVDVFKDRTAVLDGYYIFFRIRPRGSQTWPTSYDRYGVSENHTAITSNGFAVADYDAVEFILCTSSASSVAASSVPNLIDRETVYVINDGTTGTPAPTLTLTPDRIEVVADKDGVSTAATTVTVNTKMTVGGVLQSGATVSEVTNSLSGVTATKSANRVRVVIAAGTAMADYVGAVLVTAQATVDGVTHTAYANITISANRKGADGTKWQRIYRSSTTSTASTPTGDSPSGWSSTPTALTSTYRYRLMSERSSSDDGTTWTAWSTPQIDAYLGADGTNFTVKGSAIGVATGTQTCAQVCTAAGVTPVAGDIVLQNGSECTEYDILVYSGSAWVAPSDSVSVNDAYITNDGHLWVRTSSIVYSERWSDCGQIKGDKGDPGDDAELYQLQVSPSSIVVDVDNIPTPTSITIKKKKISGTTITDVNGFSVFVFRELALYQIFTTTGSSITISATDLILNSPAYIEIRDNDGTGAAPVTVPVIYEHYGHTGRMYYQAGEYSRTVTYTRTEDLCPIVLHNGAYWYLTADSSTGNEPVNNSQYWKRVQDDFSVIFTEALFANMAKLGSWVISYDYFFSQWGVMVDEDGEIEIKASRTTGYVYMKTINGMKVPYYAATSDASADKPCYIYFDESDPMAEETFPGFRPNKVIDARTGEEWSARGKMHVSQEGGLSVEGTIKATNLYHGVCVWRQDAEPWYRVLALSTKMSNAGLSVGDYVQSADITAKYSDATASDEFIPNDDTNFVLCTGPSDVAILPYVTTSSDRFINLPSPAEFEGKIIEIYDCHYGTSNPYYVKIAAAVDSVNKGFARGIYSSGPTSGGSSDTDTRTAGEKAKYISIKYGSAYWWLRLE